MAEDEKDQGRMVRTSFKRVLVCIALSTAIPLAALAILHAVQQWRVERCCTLLDSPDPKVKWEGISRAFGVRPVWPNRRVTKALLAALPGLMNASEDDRADITLSRLSYWEGSAFEAEDVPVLVRMLDVPGAPDKHGAAKVLAIMGGKAAAALPALEERAKNPERQDLNALRTAIESIRAGMRPSR